MGDAQLLNGRVCAESFRQLVDAVDGIAEIAAEIEPMTDGRAEVADRRDITRTLVKRTVLRAVERAAGAAQGDGQ